MATVPDTPTLPSGRDRRAIPEKGQPAPAGCSTASGARLAPQPLSTAATIARTTSSALSAVESRATASAAWTSGAAARV